MIVVDVDVDVDVVAVEVEAEGLSPFSLPVLSNHGDRRMSEKALARQRHRAGRIRVAGGPGLAKKPRALADSAFFFAKLHQKRRAASSKLPLCRSNTHDFARSLTRYYAYASRKRKIKTVPVP